MKVKNLMLHGNVILDSETNLINGFIGIQDAINGTEIDYVNIDLQNTTLENTGTYTVFINNKVIDLESDSVIRITVELYDDRNNLYLRDYTTTLKCDDEYKNSPSLMFNVTLTDSDVRNKNID